MDGTLEVFDTFRNIHLAFGKLRQALTNHDVLSMSMHGIWYCNFRYAAKVQAICYRLR
jgi:hypothetical protein